VDRALEEQNCGGVGGGLGGVDGPHCASAAVRRVGEDGPHRASAAVRRVSDLVVA